VRIGCTAVPEPDARLPASGSAPQLTRVRTSSVAGLVDLDLELGGVTALVGPRGSGKSQLLAAVSWLLTGRPGIAAAPGREAPSVSAVLSAVTGGASVERRPGRSPTTGRRRAGGLRLPTSSFLRARERIVPSRRPSGAVGTRLGVAARGATSDAAAAEQLVATIEACCRDGLSHEVLLIEEPELFLTPQAQRYLYSLLRRFSELGNQVMYSTRSPAFVDAALHDEIVRLDLRAGRRSAHRTSPAALTEEQRVRLAAAFDHERSEMFFANAVVLVEGQTERLSLPFVFRAMGRDPDAQGIAIVEVGGKSNLPQAARLLRELQIPFVTVFDADRGAASAALDGEIRRAAGDAPVVRLSPDFEAAAGLRSHDDKVLNAWRRFGSALAADVPVELARIVGIVGDLVASASGAAVHGGPARREGADPDSQRAFSEP